MWTYEIGFMNATVAQGGGPEKIACVLVEEPVLS